MKRIYADLDQIVFEGREQSYGGFQIRRQSNRRLTRAALVAFLGFLLITASPTILSWFFPDEPLPEMEVVTRAIPVDFTPPPIMPDETATPPPRMPSPPPQRNAAEVAFNVANPTPDEMVSEENSIHEMEDISNGNIGLVDREGEESFGYDWDGIDGEGLNLEVLEEEAPPVEAGPDDWIEGLQKEPEPIDLNAFKKEVGYPKLAVEAGIEGMVVVRVQVDKFGNYVRHIVRKDPHPLLTKAVEARLKTLKFTPAIQNGTPIKFWATVPVSFKLRR